MQSYLYNRRIIEATEHFPFVEFIVSKRYPDVARQINITEEDKLKFFFFGVLLEKIRTYCGNISIPLISGKRNSELNTLIDGSDNTDHFYDGSCGAVDFTISRDQQKLWRAYALLVKRMAYSLGQIILYLDSDDLHHPSFIHISLPNFYPDKPHWAEPSIILDGDFHLLGDICKKYSEIDSLLWTNASDLRKEDKCH